MTNNRNKVFARSGESTQDGRFHSHFTELDSTGNSALRRLEEHLNWDANDLLAKLWTWQNGDISANDLYGGNIEAALGAIKARTILIPCTNDLYFSPEDNVIEFGFLANAELKPYDSPWWYCVANPGNDPKFEKFLDDCINAVLRAADE